MFAALLSPFCVIRVNCRRRVAAVDLRTALELAEPHPDDLVEVQFVQAIDPQDAAIVARSDGWVRWR